MGRDDNIAQFFTDLTAVFEDAAGLAADGQRPDLCRSDLVRLSWAMVLGNEAGCDLGAQDMSADRNGTVRLRSINQMKLR